MNIAAKFSSSMDLDALVALVWLVWSGLVWFFVAFSLFSFHLHSFGWVEANPSRMETVL